MSIENWIQLLGIAVPALIALLGGAIKHFKGGGQIQRQKQRLDLIDASLDLYKRVPNDADLGEQIKQLASENLRRSTEAIEPDSASSREFSIGEYEKRTPWLRWISAPRPHGVRGWIGVILFYTYGLMTFVYIVMGVTASLPESSVDVPAKTLHAKIDSLSALSDSLDAAIESLKAKANSAGHPYVTAQKWYEFVFGAIGAFLMAAFGKWLAKRSMRRKKEKQAVV
jgi:hypothetical protein